MFIEFENKMLRSEGKEVVTSYQEMQLAVQFLHFNECSSR
jgi:hypothetical protein